MADEMIVLSRSLSRAVAGNSLQLRGLFGGITVRHAHICIYKLHLSLYHLPLLSRGEQ